MTKISLRAARVNAGLTQQGLAEKLGVTRDSVAAWETGKVAVKRAHLYAICHVTGADPADIFLPNESPKS